MAKENLIGQTFAGRFQVTGFLGEGGMGRIYLAQEAGADRQVALKVLHPHHGGDAEVTGRFNREMKLAEQVEHANNVRVFEYGEHEGRLFLTMEYVDGESLAEVIQESGPFAGPRVAHIARQIASALAVAHARGIIHRDLKPDNVMIEAPGERDIVKVCDFGLARFVGGEGFSSEDDPITDEEGGEEEGDYRTEVGIRVGTPHYMSPEYVASFEADHRSDLYALGVLMYEMATAKPPFDGRPFEIFEAVVKKPVVPPSRVAPGVPPWLDAIVLKLLEKDPAKRPQSADEVVDALARHAEDPPTRAASERGGPQRSAKPSGAPEGGGSKLGLVLVAGVLVLALGAAGLACVGLGVGAYLF